MNGDFSLKRKLGIKSECLRGVSSEDAIKLIKNVSFKSLARAKKIFYFIGR